ncbi:TH1 protein [Gracilaria domingensis]|nr:TH1 protein [Gracilaria domingensis]
MTDPVGVFKRPDALFNDDCTEQLRNFAKAGGNVRDACDALSESYLGLPDMIRAVVDWMNDFHDGEQVLLDALQLHLLANINTAIPTIDSELARETDSPSFISEMLTSPRWRNVLFEIASQHRQSILADRIYSEARLQQIGYSGSSISSADDVLDIVAEQLGIAMGAQSYDELDAAIRKISVIATSSEIYTFMILQLLIKLEYQSPDLNTKSGYRYVAQAVRREAMNYIVNTSGESESTAKLWIYSMLILSDCAYHRYGIPETIVDALLGILHVSARLRLEKDVKIVLHVYSTMLGQPYFGTSRKHAPDPEIPEDPKRKMLLILALRHNEIVDALLKRLFNPESSNSGVEQANLKKRNCLCLLLAYSRTFIPLQHDEILRRLSNRETLEELNNLVRRARRDLTQVVKICEELKPGSLVSKANGKHIQHLLAAVRDPTIARGVLFWAEKRLRGGKDVRSLTITLTRYLGFLETIAHTHCFLQRRVLEVIEEACIRDYPDLAEGKVEQLRISMMNSITGMVRFNMGPKIINSITVNWVRDDAVEDEHLTRFIISMLRTVSPPYHPVLYSQMIEFLQEEKVIRAAMADEVALDLANDFQNSPPGDFNTFTEVN